MNHVRPQRYRTIVADPPWPYPEGFAKNNGGRIVDGTSNPARVAPLPYVAASLNGIKALPVEELALPRNCLPAALGSAGTTQSATKPSEALPHE